jgi:hypothetical protein
MPISVAFTAYTSLLSGLKKRGAGVPGMIEGLSTTVKFVQSMWPMETWRVSLSAKKMF